MNFILLNKEEQFKELKKGDFIIVKWNDYWIDHTPKSKPIMMYNVIENKESDNEIICTKKDNHYFNYKRYLEKTSVALEVFKIVD